MKKLLIATLLISGLAYATNVYTPYVFKSTVNVSNTLQLDQESAGDDITFAGTYDRTIKVLESATDGGKTLIIQSGDAKVGIANQNAGILSLRSGKSTGNGSGVVDILTAPGNQGSSTAARAQSGNASFLATSSSNQRMLIGSRSSNSDVEATLSLKWNTERTINVTRFGMTGAGKDLTIKAGAAQAGGANYDGGQLILVGGIPTGNGTSGVTVQAAAGSGTGVSDVTPTSVATFNTTAVNFLNTSGSTIAAIDISNSQIKSDKIGELTSTKGVLIKGRTDGSSTEDGYIGQIVAATAESFTQDVNYDATVVNLNTITVPPGKWTIHGVASVPAGSYSAPNYVSLAISSGSASIAAADTLESFRQIPGSTSDLALGTVRAVNVSGSTTYYLVGRASATSGSSSWTDIGGKSIYAVRN